MRPFDPLTVRVRRELSAWMRICVCFYRIRTIQKLSVSEMDTFPSNSSKQNCTRIGYPLSVPQSRLFRRRIVLQHDILVVPFGIIIKLGLCKQKKWFSYVIEYSVTGELRLHLEQSIDEYR